MCEYIVKVKDYDQDITHTVRQLAYSKPEANELVLEYLYKALGTTNLEIV